MGSFSSADFFTEPILARFGRYQTDVMRVLAIDAPIGSTAPHPPNQPTDKPQQTTSKRALRVRAHGVLLPYPPRLMCRIWQAIATESELHRVRPPDALSEPGFPVDWLDRFAEHVQASSRRTR